MEERESNERRKFSRHACCLVTQYSLRTSGRRKRLIGCTVKNLSNNGANLISSHPLAIGTSLKLRLFNKRMQIIKFKGETRWCKKDGINWQAGIAFEQPFIEEERANDVQKFL